MEVGLGRCPMSAFARWASTALVALAAGALVPALGIAATGHVRVGLYAPKGNPSTPYSNGAVDLVVLAAGRKISAHSGVACYTGTTPTTGVPANDEVSIHLPHALTIGANRTFSFAGPVTLTPSEAQSPQPIHTTFTLRGRFVAAKQGSYAAVGTVYSPICQAATPRHFTSPYAGPAG